MRKLNQYCFSLTIKKMKGNIYIPESTNIRRGEEFFKDFLKIKYQDVDNYLENLSESPENIKAFDDLYRKIMQIKY